MRPATVHTKVHLFTFKLVNEFYYILKLYCAKDNMGIDRGVLNVHKRLAIDRNSEKVGSQIHGHII